MTDTYRYKMMFVSELRKYKQSEVIVTGNTWLSGVSCDNLGNLLFDKFSEYIFKHENTQDREYMVSIIACFVIITIADKYKSIDEFEKSKYLTYYVKKHIDNYCLLNVDYYRQLCKAVKESDLKKIEILSITAFILAQMKFSGDYKVEQEDLDFILNIFRELSIDNKEWLFTLYAELILDIGYLVSEEPVYMLSRRMQNYIQAEMQK